MSETRLLESSDNKAVMINVDGGTFNRFNEDKIKMLPDVYRKTEGHITETCKLLKIDRGTFYNWCQSYPELNQAISDVDMQLVDIAKHSLRRRITGTQSVTTKEIVNKDGDVITLTETKQIEPSDIAIMFTLNNLGQRMGFNSNKVIEDQQPTIQLPEYLSVEAKD